MSAVIKADELRELTGKTRDADIINHLRKQGIICFPGKNGPWTTTDLIELAGRVKLGLENPDPAKQDYF